MDFAFQQRVVRAAEAVLARNGSVGPLELFQEMSLLQPVHFAGWRQGNEHYRVLQNRIQVGPEKFQRTIRYFREWVEKGGLLAIEASYTRRTSAGVEQLQITQDGDPEWEKFYQTHYILPDLSEKKAAKLASKLKKAPDLVVFEKVTQDGNCSECGAELFKGNLLIMEKGSPLCLTCADLDHLVFLPAGDAALSRRSRKHSPLSAVVVRFSRTRKRYERQGLLVAQESLDKAAEECAADAPERAAARVQASRARSEEDLEFVASFTQAILGQYPGCPRDEAKQIAEHSGRRSSGRVGRSAAGQVLDPRAVSLAVIAHIRHRHTNYDELLMGGAERVAARTLVQAEIDRVLTKWQQRESPTAY
jgi:hypothetical protein